MDEDDRSYLKEYAVQTHYTDDEGNIFEEFAGTVDLRVLTNQLEVEHSHIELEIDGVMYIPKL